MFTFTDRLSSTKVGEIIGIKITTHDYESVYPTNSILSVDTGYKNIKHDGVYIFEEDSVFRIRKASLVDFSENAIVAKMTEDFKTGVEIPKNTACKGKVIAVQKAI